MLPGFTLLKKGDLKKSAPSGQADSKQAEEMMAQFTGRYLLVNLKKDFEIKPEMVSVVAGGQLLVTRKIAVSDVTHRTDISN